VYPHAPAWSDHTVMTDIKTLSSLSCISKPKAAVDERCAKCKW
jgi:hypothetical protein